MYYPTHRPQLTGIPTASVDCGVRATQMGLDWLSKGQVIRSVAHIRKVMGDDDATNYHNWDEVIDKLGGNTLGFAGEKTNSDKRIKQFINNGGAAIGAVDYGWYRKAMPNKSGSLTFNGYHAILFVGSRFRNGVRQWRAFDSLLDGRYRGCPNGPVWVPQWKALEAMRRVGQPAVYGVLLHRDADVQGIETGDLIPEAGITLSDILSDLNDIQQAEPSPDLAEVIDDFEAILGITGNPEADANTNVDDGITI